MLKIELQSVNYISSEDQSLLLFFLAPPAVKSNHRFAETIDSYAYDCYYILQGERKGISFKCIQYCHTYAVHTGFYLMYLHALLFMTYLIKWYLNIAKGRKRQLYYIF